MVDGGREHEQVARCDETRDIIRERHPSAQLCHPEILAEGLDAFDRRSDPERVERELSGATDERRHWPLRQTPRHETNEGLDAAAEPRQRVDERPVAFDRL